MRVQEATEPTQVVIDTGQISQISFAGRNCDEDLSDVDVPSSYSVSDRMWHCLLCKSSDKHRMPSWHARDIHKDELTERGEYRYTVYMERYFVECKLAPICQ